MDFDEYQKKAKETAMYPNIEHNIIYPVLGLCGETGEVAEKIKRVIRDKKGKMNIQTRLQIARELGDVLWYLAMVADELKINFDRIAKINIEKLQDRKKRDSLHGEGDNR